jgi:cytochrome c-type biogenesis protein CcmE
MPAPGGMKRKHQRLMIVLACGLGLSTAAALTFRVLSENMVFFLAPSDLAARPPGERAFRLGGLVEQGSVTRDEDAGRPRIQFRVTDGGAAVTVRYVGVVPDLFREGQGVVATGRLQPDGSFRASEVLARHDESYMPPEVADALRRAGHWNPAQGAPPPAAEWNTLRPRS